MSIVDRYISIALSMSFLRLAVSHMLNVTIVILQLL